MKYFTIVLIFLTGALLWGDVSVAVHQNGDSMRVSIEPIGIGAYVRILGCNDSTIQEGVFDSSATIDMEIPACGSLYVHWTSIDTISTADIMPMANYKVQIPGGWFKIGADVGDSTSLVDGGADESFIRACRPDRWVYVDTFIIRTIEEPCSLYAQFITDGGYSDTNLWKLNEREISNLADSMVGWDFRVSSSLDGSDIVCTDGRYPVRGISLYEALAYAHWQFGTLPTESQWEVAARLNTGWVFPWGDVFCNPDYTVTANVSDGIQCAGDPFGGGPGYPEFFAGDSSASGCLCMGGNLSEWCLDSYQSNFYGLISPLDPKFVASFSDSRTVRGGNFNTGNLYRASVFERASFSPESRQAHIGFRVVWQNSDGIPNNWSDAVFTFDTTPPDTIAILLAHSCLMDWLADSFAMVFSEPVSGDVSLVPDDPANIYPRWNSSPGETLWIIKTADATTDSDSICVDISMLTDTVGNQILVSSPVCVPLCGTCLDIVQIPETLWAPQGCFTQGIVQIVNCSDISLTIDSTMTYAPFELYGDVLNIAAGDTANLTVRFTPDCSGRISVPIVLYGDFGLYSDSLVGYGCDQPFASVQPPSLDFGETCDTMCLPVKIISNGCSSGMLEVCDIFWNEGVNFTLDSVNIGDTLMDSLQGFVCFDSVERGEQIDTLHIRFRPIGGECCEFATLTLPVRATCFGTACDPHTDVEAVLGNGTNSVLFSCIVKNVEIYDRWGRFVVKLEPDKFGDVNWNLTDDDGNLVPAGVYIWKSGKFSGKIIVVR